MRQWKTSKTQHPTSNIQRFPLGVGWMLSVRRWMLDVAKGSGQGRVSWSAAASPSTPQKMVVVVRFPLLLFDRFQRALRQFMRGVVDAEIVLRSLVALSGGADEPAERLALAFGHAAARLVTEAEVALRGRDLLLGGG